MRVERKQLRDNLFIPVLVYLYFVILIAKIGMDYVGEAGAVIGGIIFTMYFYDKIFFEEIPEESSIKGGYNEMS